MGMYVADNDGFNLILFYFISYFSFFDKIVKNTIQKKILVIYS